MRLACQYLSVLSPIGAAGSADFVPEELQGGYFMEIDDAADE